MADKNIKAVYVRFNLNKPLHKKAYDLLQEQSEFSNSQDAINAILDYYDNQIREDRLVEKIANRLSGFAPKSASTVSKNANSQSEEISIDDIDFDFLGG